MKVCGIIVEYNPFHNGHLYHINKARELTKCDVLIAIMSPNFMQRGEPAIINKFERAKIALDNHVDLVVELPSIYAIQSANYFARGALELLNQLRIDYLVFGMENDSLDNLKKAASISNSNEYQEVLKQYLNNGISYALACNKALAYFDISKVDQANDILALAYLQEIEKNNYHIKAIGIKRTNNYLDNTLHDNISSASAIRNALFNNIDITKQTSMAKILYDKKNELVNYNDYFIYLKYKLYTISINDLQNIYGMSEGLEFRLKEAINNVSSIEEFINTVSSKRYPKTRIQRLIVCILINLTKEDMANLKVDYIRILASNEIGLKYLKIIKDVSTYKIITSYANHKSNVLDLEHSFTKLYSLAKKDVAYLIKKEYQEHIIIK